MRPERLDRPDAGELAAHVDELVGRVDGRVGVVVGRPAGPTMDEFDAVLERRADRTYAAASVIKVPLLYALYWRHEGALEALEEPRPIAPENRVGGSGLLHLLDGAEPSLRDLARAMVAVSDNAATNELIDHLGMDAVADVAAAIGLEHTALGRKMMATLENGGADTDVPVNTTSPRDCARLFAALLHGDHLSEAARAEQLGILRTQKDRSLFPRYLPYEVDLAHKPGWLPGVALDTGLLEGFGEPPLFFAVCCDRCSNGGDASDLVAEVGDVVYAWMLGSDHHRT